MYSNQQLLSDFLKHEVMDAENKGDSDSITVKHIIQIGSLFVTLSM